MSLLSRIPERKDRPEAEKPEKPLRGRVLAHLLADQAFLEALDFDDADSLFTKTATWLDAFLSSEESDATDDGKKALTQEIADRLHAYRAFFPALADPAITEVMCYAPDQIVTDSPPPFPLTFDDAQTLFEEIAAVCRTAGRPIDALSGTTTVLLPDGWALIVNLPPERHDAIIARFHRQAEPARIEKAMLESEAITPNALAFMRACVIAHLNVIVSSNHRPLMFRVLNLLAGYIPPEERATVLARPGQVNLPQARIITPWHEALDEDTGDVSARRAMIQQARLMGAKRLILSEVESGEAFDFLNLLKNGYEGSMAAIFARGAKDALHRLVLNCALSGEKANRLALRQLADQSVHVIIHAERMNDGSERVRQITEVQGMSGEVNVMVDLFRYDITGMIDGKYEGRLVSTGIRPAYARHFDDYGVHLPAAMFSPHMPAPRDRKR